MWLGEVKSDYNIQQCIDCNSHAITTKSLKKRGNRTGLVNDISVVAKLASYNKEQGSCQTGQVALSKSHGYSMAMINIIIPLLMLWVMNYWTRRAPAPSVGLSNCW